ncbi:MAG: 50S ribosomal protein L28 [Syntrophomonadaceae bacterium]|nr:50S ribosomal protein L28 [Syntrophomonadaceae bacterium]
MAKCSVCGKGISFGKKYSHSHIRTNRQWKPNIQNIRVLVNGTPKKISVCTRCLRSKKVEKAL